MKLSHRWLQRYIADLPDADTVSRYLEQLGFEVARIESYGREFAAVELVEVIRRDPHPNADHLSLLEVRRGTGETTQVVTGATNGMPGQRLWYAPPGSKLPDGRVLEVVSLRGVDSPGMLLSAQELGFRAGPGDLWVWSGPEKLGARFLDVLGGVDSVYELELTPNIAVYMQSVYAIARELAAVMGRELLPEPPSASFGQDPLIGAVDVETCPLYGLLEWEVDPLGASPLWMQALLRALGLRVIHPVVDVTNFVLWDLGQPLHAFDKDRVVLPITVRKSRAGETLKLLDGTEIRLDIEDLVIADQRGPVALAGIMGGEQSGITPATRTVLLESAHFRAPGIFKSMRRHQLFTDAALHFAKGTDPTSVFWAPEMVRSLLGDQIIAYRGSALTGTLPKTRSIPWQPDRIRSILGVDWEEQKIRNAVSRLGYVERDRRVHIPRYRHDVEGTHDLAEDVARFYGLDQIPERLPVMASIPGERDRGMAVVEELRTLLAAAGYYEVITRTFTSSEREAVLAARPDWTRVRLTNPLRDEEEILRTDLLTSLLEVVAYNRSRRDQAAAIFEVAPVFYRDYDTIHERLELTVVDTLEPRERFPHEPEPSILDLKGILEWLNWRLGWGLSFPPIDTPPGYFHPGRTVSIRQGSENLGYLGELRPQVSEQFRAHRLAVLSMLVPDAVRPNATTVTKPSRFPAIIRDVSLVVPDSVSFETIRGRIRSLALENLARMVLIDLFRGDFGQSLTIRFEFQSMNRTLEDREVDQSVERMLSNLKAIRVVLRQ